MKIYFNPFSPNASFLYTLKHERTIRFSDVFRRYRKDALETNGLKIMRYLIWIFFEIFNPEHALATILEK